MRPVTLVGLAAALVLPLSACNQTELAYGDANSIIVVTGPELWEAVQDSVYSALEPYITTTVAREEIFMVTWQDPAAREWVNLRKFRQLLLFGAADNPLIAEVLASGGRRGDDAPEGSVQVFDMWARGQVVTAVPLASDDDVEGVLASLPALQEMFLRQYRQWATNRMFVSGRDSALADTLRATAGFSLLLPAVYYWDRQDSVLIFRNDNPDPAELIRQLTVTWRTPTPAPLDLEALLAWRNAVAAEYYSEPQALDLSLASEETFEHQGLPAFRLQAVWQNTPESGWPAAGPLIVQTVECPGQDRLYLLDAWLYAPGRDKYEYMVQLETILSSFRCGM